MAAKKLSIRKAPRNATTSKNKGSARGIEKGTKGGGMFWTGKGFVAVPRKK